MRKTRIAPLLLLSLGLARADFDPREPISLDLRDAKLTEVITLLGAIANLPVVIGQGVEGIVTVQLHDVPFEQALELISRKQGISLRIDNGKLVASRPKESPPAAPVLSEQFRDAPRILLSEYRKAASHPPSVTVRIGPKGQEECYVPRFEEGKAGIVQVPMPSPREGLFLIALAYDPASKTRYLAVDSAQDRASAVFALGPGAMDLWERRDSSGSVRVWLSTGPVLEDCRELTPKPGPVGSGAALRFEGFLLGASGERESVFAPRIQMMEGSLSSARSGSVDAQTNQQKQLFVTAYLSRDGKGIAVVFGASRIWKDPEDGREYLFSEFSRFPSSSFLPLRSEPVVAAKIPAGAATAESIELRVSRED